MFTFRQVVPREEWPGVGRMVDVRVKLGTVYVYTTKILKPGQSLVELVRNTRKEFRK